MKHWSLAFAILAAAILVAPTACREHGRPDPDIRMAPSHERDESGANPGQGAGQATAAQSDAAQGQGQGGPGQVPSVPTRLEIPDAVKQAYSGIVLVYRDKQGGQEGRLEVPFGGSAEIPGSGLSVAADVFLPAFTMTAQTITSSGVEEQNPAARIRVSESGREIFGGWIFKRFPDVHPFTRPRYGLRLDGGIHAPGK